MQINLGASSGIGAGTAIYLANNGAKLALAGRKEENLKTIATKCEQINPSKEKVKIFCILLISNNI